LDFKIRLFLQTFKSTFGCWSVDLYAWFFQLTVNPGIKSKGIYDKGLNVASKSGCNCQQNLLLRILWICLPYLPWLHSTNKSISICITLHKVSKASNISMNRHCHCHRHFFIWGYIHLLFTPTLVGYFNLVLRCLCHKCVSDIDI